MKKIFLPLLLTIHVLSTPVFSSATSENDPTDPCSSACTGALVKASVPCVRNHSTFKEHVGVLGEFLELVRNDKKFHDNMPMCMFFSWTLGKEPLNLETFQDAFNPFLDQKYPDGQKLNTRKHLTMLQNQVHAFTVYFHIFFYGYAENKAALVPDSQKSHDFDTVYYNTILRRYFLSFQYVSNIYMEILQHYKKVPIGASYGTVIGEKNSIVYLKDNNGYIFVPNDISKGEVLQTIPYGEGYNQLNGRVFLKKGNIVENPALMLFVRPPPPLPSEDKYPWTAHLYNGANPYNPFRLTLSRVCVMKDFFELERTSLIDSDARHRAHNYFLWDAFHEEVIPGKKAGVNGLYAHIALPSSTADHCETDYLTLTHLIETAKDSSNPEHESAVKLLEYLEKESGKTAQVLQQDLEAQLLAAYEEKIQAEQQMRAQRVADGTTPTLKQARGGKAKHGRGGKGGKTTRFVVSATTSPSSSAASSSSSSQSGAVSSAARALFDKFKVEGPTKWKDVLRLVSGITKRLPSLEGSDVKIAGSHITFHGEGTSSVTVAQKHGRHDRSLQSGTVNSFTMQLIQFALKRAASETSS